MILSLIMLFLSLVMMTIGAEFIVRGGIGLARRLGLSTFFIGLTVVGFGTSAPELAATVGSAIKGHGEIAIGNVVGSNIMNIALVMAAAAILMPIPVKVSVLRKEVFLVIAVSFIPYASLVSGGSLLWWQGVLMVIGMAWFLYASYRHARVSGGTTIEPIEVPGTMRKQASGVPGSVILLLVGLVALAFGSNVLVDSAVDLARGMGVSELVIALTIVAGGTSAPEFTTAVIAGLRGESDIGIGNLLGSCIFNLLGVLGITCMVAPVPVPEQVLWLDAPVMILVAVMCAPIMFTGSRISRAEGGLLLGVFCLYIASLLMIASGVFSLQGGSSTETDSIQPPPSTTSPS